MRPIVVKIGGSLMESSDNLRGVARALASLWSAGIPLVLVHGGGKDINRNLQWLGEEPKFKNGLRVTSEDALLIVEMTLSGSVNKRLVSLLQDEGARSCGISGVDASTLLCHPVDPELGRVGTVFQVRPALVESLLQSRFLPVVSPISTDTAGAHYNVNADDAASALAVALKAERLVYVSDVPGVMNSEKHIVPQLNRENAESMIGSQVIAGGMIPKVHSCLSAVEAGVGEVHICGFTSSELLEKQISGAVNSGTIVGV